MIMINKLGAKLGIDLKYIFKGGFWISIGQVVSSMSAFLLAIVYANWLTPETYGTYKYVISMIGILSIPTLSGLSTSVSKSIVQGKEGSLLFASRVKIKWGMLGTAAGLVLSFYYYLNNNAELSIAFALASLFIPILEGYNLYDSYLYAKKKFREATLFYIFGQITTSLIILSIAVLNPKLIWILFAYLGSWSLIRWVLFRWVINKYRPNNEIDPEAIPYGKHLTAIKAFNVLASYLDKILLFQFVGSGPLAIYSITQAPLDQIRSLVTRGISLLAFPKYAEKENDLVKKSVTSWTLKTTIVLFFAAIFYIIFIPYVFPVFFPLYSEYIWYTQLAALSIIPLASFIPYTALNAHALKKELYYYNISSAFFQITTLIILTYTAGIVGVIIARILSRLFELIVGLILTTKK